MTEFERDELIFSQSIDSCHSLAHDLRNVWNMWESDRQRAYLVFAGQMVKRLADGRKQKQ